MNTFFTRHISADVFSAFIILIVTMFLTGAASVAHADSPRAQLSIASNGQVIVRNATVAGISGTVLTVKSEWGALAITWTIKTSGSTHFVPDAKSTEALTAIKLGDSIAFSGDIDSQASSPTVLASTVKNTTVERDSVTEAGTVTAVDDRTGTFIISTNNGTTTVDTVSGTILTLDGNFATLRDLTIGTDVEVIGSLNTDTNIIVAQRASWRTPSESISNARPGMIAGFFSWLLGSRGALSSL